MPQSYFGKDALEEDYKAALRGFRHSISLNGAYTAVILILLGVLLDYFVYPQHQLAFAISRIVCVGFILLMVEFIKTSWGKLHTQELTCLWLLLPQIHLCWMIYYSDGSASIYYIALTLAIYGFGIVMAFGVAINIMFGVATYLIYMLACFLHPQGLGNDFVINSTFLMMSIIVSVFCSFFNEKPAQHCFYSRLKWRGKM